MNVSLTPELERFVQEKVHSGRYTSASEVVREALRLLEEHEQVRMAQLAKFREEIDQRLASLERGEGLDGATVLAQLRHRSHARRQSHL
jgi:antitoxin ParD1/3/4